jgi:vacuolar-type H+-ATPase subunit H
MSTRDVYIAKIKQQLDELNQAITELETRTNDAKLEAREKYKEEIAKLHHQSVLAQAKLEEVRTTTEEKWDSMVTEMEKIRDAFKHSFSYFKSQIK